MTKAKGTIQGLRAAGFTLDSGTQRDGQTVWIVWRHGQRVGTMVWRASCGMYLAQRDMRCPRLSGQMMFETDAVAAAHWLAR